MTKHNYYPGARFKIRGEVQTLDHIESGQDDPLWVCANGNKYSVSFMEVEAKPYITMTEGAAIYTHSRWDKMIEAMFDEVRHLAKAKGGEYSGDTDRLLNFRRNAAALGLDMETVWAVYSAKHWDAIMQYVRDLREGKTRLRLEGIDGRIKDLIVYLLLFQAMVEERSDEA